MKQCQRCQKPASLHITELESVGKFEDLHFCEECGRKYIFETMPKKKQKAMGEPIVESAEEAGELNERHCEVCGVQFVEFRNSGKLGCPHDYQAFQAELIPLLESIHGSTKHSGKSPRRQPRARATHQELARLRKKLQLAVDEEEYEEAAQVRDRIRQLEQSL
jgi:protein arginine kinase activator